MNAVASLFAEARAAHPAASPEPADAFTQAIMDIALQKAMEAKEEEARELAWNMLIEGADDEDRLDEQFGRLMCRDVFIVLAGFIGVSALFVAIDDIHPAAGLIVLASIASWCAVFHHRRAEALNPEGVDA